MATDRETTLQRKLIEAHEEKDRLVKLEWGLTKKLEKRSDELAKSEKKLAVQTDANSRLKESKFQAEVRYQSYMHC